jgi:hypothetical protein
MLEIGAIKLDNVTIAAALFVVAGGVVGTYRSFSTSQRLHDLLRPMKVSSFIGKMNPGVFVTDVNVLEVHRCGDGFASTTDRIVLELVYSKESKQTVLPPKRMMAKVILLNNLMRMGASESIITFAGNLARILEHSPIRILRFFGRMVWSSMVLYQHYFPHAPDVMYRTESRVYHELYKEFNGAGIRTPACYGVITEEDSNTFGVLIEDLSLRQAAFPNALRNASVAEVRALLSTLARMHAFFWDSPRFRHGGNLSWLPTHLEGGMQPVFSAIGCGLIEDQVQRHTFKAGMPHFLASNYFCSHFIPSYILYHHF